MDRIKKGDILYVACHILPEKDWVCVHKQPCMLNSVATLQSAGNGQGSPPPMSNPIEENLFHDMRPVIRKAKKVCRV